MASKYLIPPPTPAKTHASAKKVFENWKSLHELGPNKEIFSLLAEKKYIRTRRKKRKAVMPKNHPQGKKKKSRWFENENFTLLLSMKIGRKTSKKMKLDLKGLICY